MQGLPTLTYKLQVIFHSYKVYGLNRGGEVYLTSVNPLCSHTEPYPRSLAPKQAAPEQSPAMGQNSEVSMDQF